MHRKLDNLFMLAVKCMVFATFYVLYMGIMAT